VEALEEEAEKMLLDIDEEEVQVPSQLLQPNNAGVGSDDEFSSHTPPTSDKGRHKPKSKMNAALRNLDTVEHYSDREPESKPASRGACRSTKGTTS
jgi:hypothetical protein